MERLAITDRLSFNLFNKTKQMTPSLVKHCLIMAMLDTFKLSPTGLFAVWLCQAGVLLNNHTVTTY